MSNFIFQNYHKHTYWSNIKVPDSATSLEEYCKRAVELGHGIICSLEHGWQGHYIECHQLAAKYGLKFVFGTEAYWVKDRHEKDGSNCHICILAKNENGRQAINDILSQAAIDGYYRQSRIDLPLIMTLPPEDVIITTACVAFWKYDDIDSIIKQLFNRFGKNFYLEVQYHNTPSQKQINKHILDLRKTLGIQLMMGCDSHYIDQKGAVDRDEFIKSKGMEYPDENDWYMDYPDGETAYKRFVEQCVLDHEQIMEAINNTNIFLEVEEYDCPIFNHDIKMPTLYPDLTQQERDSKLETLIWDKWSEYKKEVPTERHSEYEEQIKYELDIVKTTFHADYFLLDYAITQLGKKKGGQLTLTGRGSGVSFFLNKLLGFTSVDRISAKVKMYPERFMSPTRILETHSLADIDMNVAKQEPFWEAQEELLGYEHSKQMITFQQLKPAAAWKMYAKSQGVDFETSNAISGQIAKYLKDYAKAKEEADDDEEIDIDILDYIDEKYKDIYLKSEDYLGVISAVSSHPCGSLIYAGNIRKEIGYIYVKSQSSDGMICCCMDGKWAEKYGFLKNDWLKVNVVEVIYKIFERIGMEPFSSTELIEKCKDDPLPWNLYKQQCTKGLNQVEQPSSSTKVGAYAPKNISELTAFVAAVRPGFKSMYDIFESREHFDYKIPAFDNLLQTDEMPNSFVLYQEQAMLTLNYAGIPMSECYAVIKAISKKRVDEITKNKPIFIDGFQKRLKEDDGSISDIKAEEVAHQVWQIIEDSSKYSFNSAHAYSVALDSLYQAWLKSHYPLEFYETYLNILNKKGAKDRLNKFKEEAEHYFKIYFPPFKFRQDNRSITIDHENNAINNALSSIKGYSNIVAEELYTASAHHDFISVLTYLDSVSIKSAKIIPLIKIGYFSEFGNEKALLKFMDYWDMLKQGNAKQISKDKVDDIIGKYLAYYGNDKNKDGSEAKSWKLDADRMPDFLQDILQDCVDNIPAPTYKERMAWQQEILGYIELTTGKKEDTKKILVLDVKPLIGQYSPNPWCYKVDTRSIGTGRSATLNVDARTWDAYGPLKCFDIVNVGRLAKNKKGYWYMYDYEKENEQ